MKMTQKNKNEFGSVDEFAEMRSSLNPLKGKEKKISSRFSDQSKLRKAALAGAMLLTTVVGVNEFGSHTDNIPSSNVSHAINKPEVDLSGLPKIHIVTEVDTVESIAKGEGPKIVYDQNSLLAAEKQIEAQLDNNDDILQKGQQIHLPAGAQDGTLPSLSNQG